jgi:transposase
MQVFVCLSRFSEISPKTGYSEYHQKTFIPDETYQYLYNLLKFKDFFINFQKKLAFDISRAALEFPKTNNIPTGIFFNQEKILSRCTNQHG